MRMTLIALPLLVVGCGQDEMHLSSHIEQTASLEVRAPFSRLRGGCNVAFRERFCREEYEVIGVVDLGPGTDRVLALSDPVNDEQCGNVLWLRLLRLDQVGPVDDPGTTFQLPSDAQIERGAGAYHSVAFPQATVRLDELGNADDNQSGPPPTCAELSRLPR